MKMTGKIEVNNGLRVKVDLDFCRYYMWLATKYHYNTQKYQLPMHGAHISIYLPHIHGKIDLTPYKKLHGSLVDFDYDLNNIVITKKNVWIPVKSSAAYEIKKSMGITDKNFLGFHLTVCNTKFDN